MSEPSTTTVADPTQRDWLLRLIASTTIGIASTVEHIAGAVGVDPNDLLPAPDVRNMARLVVQKTLVISDEDFTNAYLDASLLVVDKSKIKSGDIH